MSMFDLNSNTTLNNLAAPTARTATGTGSSIDVRTQNGLAAVMLSAAAGTGTTPTLDVTIQDSVDGSTGWTNITGAAFTQVTTADSAQKIGVNLDACRGFIRASWTIGGTTPSFNFAVAVLGRTN